VGVDELHLDRARGESFGSRAQQYDRDRPTYPDVLLDDLAALDPMQVLRWGVRDRQPPWALAHLSRVVDEDLVARRCLSVLGVEVVEVDVRMAEVARGCGIAVEVAALETWGDAGRQFDLITCADAWHWINLDLGILKAARVLRAGGTIARFPSSFVVDEPVIAAFESV
jgi:hypothetical protein